MDEYSTNALNDRLQIIADRIAEQPEIGNTYLQPHIRKCGGSYVTDTSGAKKFDEHKRIVIVTDGTTSSIDEIVGIEGAIFEMLDDQ